MQRKSDLTSVRAILSGMIDAPVPHLREWWEVRNDPTLKAEADAVLEDLRQRRLVEMAAEEIEVEPERIAA